MINRPLHHFFKKNAHIQFSAGVPFLAFLLGFPLLFWPQRIQATQPVKELKLSAKHARLIVAKRKSKRAQLVVQFQTGAFDDGLVAGLTRASQHALLYANRSGSGKKLRQAIYDAGGTLVVTLGVRRARFVLDAPKTHFSKLTKSLLALLFDFQPNVQEIEYLKRILSNERIESGASADAESFIAGSVIFMEGGANGNEYNNPLFPDSDSLYHLHINKITQHIAHKMQPANATVVASGNVNSQELMRIVKKYKGGSRRPLSRPNPAQAMPLEIQRAALSEVHMRVQLVSLDNNEKKAAAHLLNAVLQDQSMWSLRKKGMTYSTSSTLVSREWMDYIFLIIPVSKSSHIPVQPQITRLTQKLIEQELDDKIFERNRAYTLHALQALDEDYQRIGRLLADSAPTTPLLNTQTLHFLRTFSKKRFLELARPWLLPSSTVKVALGRNLRSSIRSHTSLPHSLPKNGTAQ